MTGVGGVQIKMFGLSRLTPPRQRLAHDDRGGQNWVKITHAPLICIPIWNFFNISLKSQVHTSFFSNFFFSEVPERCRRAQISAGALNASNCKWWSSAPASSGSNAALVSTPPDLFVFVMYFVHESGSTPLALS